MKSPIGELTIHSTDDTISAVKFESLTVNNKSAEQQLSEYFDGKRVNFDLKIAPEGTLFQKQVWDEIQKIPFGETATYAQIAKRIGRPEAWRAVANACAANPILIIIPCHRVIDSRGKLGGYAGGVERKQWLLDHEQAVRSRIYHK